MANVLPNAQYKTSTIITNESLVGFKDRFEFLGRVNHDYQQLLDDVGGLPTNGTIGVRQIGYPQMQYGLEQTVKAVEQQYENIIVNTEDMVGNTYDVDPVSLMVSRNKVTDTTHYQTCQQIASSTNVRCYEDLMLHANIHTGDVTSDTVSGDLIIDINTLQDTLNIPAATSSFFLSTKSYGSLAKQILQTNTFDQELNRDNVGFKVQSYFGQPLIVSSSLASLGHASFYPTGKALAFGVLTSSDSYKSCVITLTGGTAGDILSPGDRLQFATTKRLNRSTKLDTDQALQLVVQNTVTAGVGGTFTGVQCEAGISPLLTFDSSSADDNWYSNVTAVPATGEVVNVVGNYAFNVATVKPGFTFATVTLPPMKTLDVPAWYAGNEVRTANPGVRRNSENKAAPVQIYTSFDADIKSRVFFMRVDMQPVYKTFVDYNIAILTKYNGPSFTAIQAAGFGNSIERIRSRRQPVKFDAAKEVNRLRADSAKSADVIANMQKAIEMLTAAQKTPSLLDKTGEAKTTKLS